MKNPLCLQWTKPRLWQSLLCTVIVVLAGCGGGGGGSESTQRTTIMVPLTDTGITSAQCYGEGSNTLVSCTSTEATSLNSQQDGMVGRDVSNPDNKDGKLGFSYSLVPKSGGGTYDKTECVKDNITGLMWEGKPASGTRGNPELDPNGQYSNYASGLFGTEDQVKANTNAQGYVNAVNAAGLCGHKDWRLPEASELQSIVDYGVASGSSIDGNWFPDTKPDSYWTSSPYVESSSSVHAWYVNFGDGSVENEHRGDLYYVRLVR